MHTFTILTALVAAIPAALAQGSAISSQFYLRTKGASSAHRFNHLYVTPYHTGAGFNDVSLEVAKPNQPAYLNGSYLLFNFSAYENSPTVPYAMVNALIAEYASWQPVEINIGYGASTNYSQYSLNGSNLVWNSDPGHPNENSFKGWRVCDWWHDVPQLFWLLNGYNATTPKACSDVDLVVEYVK